MRKTKVTFAYDESLFEDKKSFEDYLKVLESEDFHIEYIDYLESNLEGERAQLITSTGETIKVFIGKPFTPIDELVEEINAHIDTWELNELYSYATSENVNVEWIADTDEESVYREIHPDVDKASYPVWLFRFKEKKK